MGDVRVAVLGPIGVRRWTNDQRPSPPLVTVAGHPAALVACLAAAHPHAVPADELVEALWGDRPPPTSANGLRVLVTGLRRALRDTEHPDPVPSAAGTYRLALDADELDAARFADAVTVARRALDDDPRRALVTLDDALALWRGPAFAGVDVERVRAAGSALDLLRLDAEEDAVEARLRLGDPAGAARLAERLVEEQPWREHRWCQLMLALYRAGRQAESLRAFQHARRRLADDLGLTPGAELTAMEQAVLMHDPELDEAGTPRDIDVDDVGRFVRALRGARTRATFPATTLVGRTRERAVAGRLLDDHRVVALVGPAGVGKSRLAAAVATDRAADDPRRDAVLVPLAVADDESSIIVAALADQLAISPRDGEEMAATVLAHLRGTAATIVFDDADRVQDELGALVEVLLATCPRVEVIVTTRDRRFGPGGRLVLGPLPPEDARQLFAQRSATAADEAPTVGARIDDLLERLDRLPLAIELAARAADTMTLGEVEALVQRAPELEPVVATATRRHHDLDRAVAWSHERLDDGGQRVISRLGVFLGPFRAADAAAVLELPADVVTSHLTTLASLSLLTTRRGADVSEYELSHTVRSFAERRADPAARRADGSRHARFFTELAVALDHELRSSREVAAVPRLNAVIDDLRAAFQRLVEDGDVERASAMATAAWTFGQEHQHYDTLDWADVVLGLPGVEALHDHARLVGHSSFTAWLRGDPDRAERLANQALTLPHADEYAREVRGPLVNVAGYRGDFEGALVHHRVVLAAAQRRGDDWELVHIHAIGAIAGAVFGLDEIARAEQYRCVAAAERLDCPSAHAWAAYVTGIVHADRHPDESLASFEHGAALARSVSNHWVTGMDLAGATMMLRRLGRLDDARCVLPELLVLFHRGNHVAQLKGALVEAALVDARRRPDIARLALALADRIPLGHPPLPADVPRIAEVRAELGDPPSWIGPLDDAVNEVVDAFC